MEDKGFEPHTSPERSEHSAGQNQVNAGQNQGLAPKNRTDPDGAGTAPEPTKDHNRYITGYTTGTDLKSLVDAWPELSQEAKRGIAGIVEAEKKKK